MRRPYQRFVDHLTYTALRTAKVRWRRKPSRMRDLEQLSFAYDEVKAGLEEYPLHNLPSREEHANRFRAYFMTNGRRPTVGDGPDEDVLDILEREHLRRCIEVLALMGYSPQRIQLRLSMANGIQEAPGTAIIAEYLSWFFDLGTLSETERNAFLAQVREDDFYRYHLAQHTGTISQSMLLEMLELKGKSSLNDRLLVITNSLLAQLEENLLGGDQARVQSGIVALRDLSQVFDRLGGEVENHHLKLFEMITLRREPQPHDELTMEDILAHNARIDAEQAAARERGEAGHEGTKI